MRCACSIRLVDAPCVAETSALKEQSTEASPLAESRVAAFELSFGGWLRLWCIGRMATELEQ